jgi:hypothetical protein
MTDDSPGRNVFKNKKVWVLVCVLAICGLLFAAGKGAFSPQPISEVYKSGRPATLKDEEVYRKMRENEQRAWENSTSGKGK